jgi:hypothetical protein
MAQRQIEWLNANNYRRYPFVENSPDVVPSPGVTMTDSTVLDFDALDYTACERRAKLTGLTVASGSPGTVTFEFTIYRTGGPDQTVTFVVPENAAFPYTVTAYSVGAVHARCIFGEGVLALLAGLADGAYAVNAPVEQALVAAQCKHRVNELLATAPGSTPAVNNVYFQEGHNCQVTIIPASDIVKIAAVLGAGEGKDCDPVPGKLQCYEVLLRINGLRADDNGAFILGGGEGVQVIPDPANHRIIIKGMTAQLDDNACGG